MVELSSLDVLYLARELGALDDAYIDRVYELDAGEFLLRTRHPELGRQNLLIKPGAYACLVPEAPETPQSPTSFATVLRKHLPGLRIRRVVQHGFDRVLVFELDERGQPLRLIVELFGKGNLVLVGADGVVRVAQRTETFRDRVVRRGEAFRFPPSRVDPLTLSHADFDRTLEAGKRDVVRFLATDVAMGGDLAEEIVQRAGVAKERRVNEMDATERDALWRAWQQIIGGQPEPGLAAFGAQVRAEAIPYRSSKYVGWARTPTPTLSAAIDLARKAAAEAAPEERDEERERLQRQVEAQAAAIAEMEAEAQRWEELGRHVYERYADAEAGLLVARQVLDRLEWGDLPAEHRRGALPPGIVAVDPEARRMTLRVGDVDWRVDPRQSLERNASQTFDEAKRVRAKTEGARLALADAQRRLASRVQAPKAKAEPPRRAPDKRFWFESFRWCYTTDGLLVVGGRDAASNEKLVKKHLAPGDLYFHADFHGAPSCVLKTEGKQPAEDAIRQAAHFAVCFSRAFAQFGSADAYWVRPEQVSKTAPTGEYVAKGAFIVRGQRNYVPQLPMQVAVGRVGLGKDGKPSASPVVHRLMSGPVDAVRAWCKRFALVVRGDAKPAATAKELAPRFDASIDEMVAALPASTLRVQQLPEAEP